MKHGEIRYSPVGCDHLPGSHGPICSPCSGNVVTAFGSIDLRRDPCRARPRGCGSSAAGVLDDTTGTYSADPLELMRRLPARLTRQGQRTAALNLLELLGDYMGDVPRYWQELGNAQLYAGQREKVESALRKALEIMPDRADIAWMLDHMDQLIETVDIQLATENRYAPGENTGIQGPYLGQPLPGRKPEVFAPGILSTTDHEYFITFSPDGGEIYFSRGGLGTYVCRWLDGGGTAPEIIHLLNERLGIPPTGQPALSPDGKYIFFCICGDIYWADAGFLAELDPN